MYCNEALTENIENNLIYFLFYFRKTQQLELENINLQKSNLFCILLPQYSLNKKLMGETDKKKDSKDSDKG